MWPKTLLIGVGNTLREDDGLGAFVCRYFEKKGLENISVMVVHQLDSLLLNSLNDYERIIIVDAAINLQKVQIRKIESEDSRPNSFTHEMDAYTFAALAYKLFNNKAAFFTCAIPASNFGVKDHLSAEALHSAEQAVETITNTFFQKITG